jgi:alkaline phosphatase D
MRLAREMSSALLLLGMVPSGLSPAAPLPRVDRHGVLVTVAEVRPDRATIWLRGDHTTAFALRYAPADEAAPVQQTTIVPSPARDHTGRAVLTGLTPGTRYVYEARQDGVSAAGTFVTAPAPDADATVRLAWSGDLGGGGHCRDVEDGYRIFDALARRQPDLFLFIGDTIYADQLCGTRPHVPGADYVATTLAEFHGKHRYNRADHVLQEFFRTTAVYATWDDHEVRNNFVGPTEPLMPVARQAMLDYWPIEGPPEEPERLYRSMRWGRHVEIFILDTRQYRSPNTQPDGPGKTMLGLVQRAWLERGLAASDATWKLVVTSVPLGMFTGGRDSDSWSNANVFGFARARGGGFVHERDGLLRFVRERAIRNVVFVSGDVHHAELLRHEPSPGFVVHELVAGPLSARQGYPRFLDRSLHSRSLGGVGFATNFGELVIDGTALQARIFDASDTARASLRLATDGSVSRAQADTPAPRRRHPSTNSASRASTLNAPPASSGVAAP